MSQLLSLSRAARLVGVTRGTLQKKIKDGELPTFDGVVRVEDLLRAFPEARLDDDAGLERIQQIKDSAYARRIRERILPDPEVLLARFTELAHELGDVRKSLARHHDAIEDLGKTLVDLERRGGETARVTRALRAWLRDTLATESDSEKTQSLMAMENVMRLVSANVRLLPSGHEFFVEGSDTILEAALRAGLSVDYGCSNGACGLCKARVVSGQAKKVRPHDYVLTESDKAAGCVLLCSNTAVTDLVVEATEAHGAKDIPRQQIGTRVHRTERLSGNMWLLHVQTPRTNRLRFLAGQSVEVTFGEGQKSVQPIASCPCDDRNIQFHMHLGDDALSRTFAALKVSDSVALEGPMGEFTLDDESTRPLLFVACNSGFAPIKSLIEHAMAVDVAESIHLYWLARDPEGHYLSNVCRAWADALDNFHFTPLVVDAVPDGSLSPEGLAGAVQRMTMDHPDLGAYDVYVAGSDAAVAEIEFGLLERGVPRERLKVSSGIP